MFLGERVCAQVAACRGAAGRNTFREHKVVISPLPREGQGPASARPPDGDARVHSRAPAAADTQVSLNATQCCSFCYSVPTWVGTGFARLLQKTKTDPVHVLAPRRQILKRTRDAKTSCTRAGRHAWQSKRERSWYRCSQTTGPATRASDTKCQTMIRTVLRRKIGGGGKKREKKNVFFFL